MIRNVVVGRLRQADDPAQQAADAALLDEEHNRLRREIFAKICQDIARVQIDVPG